MMHEGRIIVDISGEEKKNLTVDTVVESVYSGKRWCG